MDFSHLGRALPALARACVCVIAILSAQSVPAQSSAPGTFLAYEPFDSAPEPLHGAGSGFGWAAPWVVQNSSIANPGYSVSSQSLAGPAGLPEAGGKASGGNQYLTAGRRLDVSAAGPFAPYLSSGFIGAAGQTLWFSVLLEKDSNTGDSVSFTLHSGNVPWNVQTTCVAVGYFGSASNSGTTRYWSLKVGTQVYPTTTPVVIGQPVFLVARIDFAPSSTVSLFVNPAPGSTPPATFDAQAAAPQSLAFGSVAYYGGSQPNQSSLDEIRFSQTFQGATTATGAIPGTPTGLAVVPGNSQLTLTWTAVPGATSYQVWQDVAGAVQLIATTQTNSYLVTGLQNGAGYRYFVIAVSSAGSSPASVEMEASSRPSPSPAQPGLGTNLSQIADWSRELPFADAFKSARPWIAQQQGSPWGQGGSLQLTPEGWIASLQPGQYAETIMLDNAVSDTADYPTGNYTLLYDGNGTVAFDLNSAAVVSQSAGRIVVSVPSGGNGVYLMVTGTDPSNPIRNIRFIMPGLEATYQTQPFNPAFLNLLQNYKALRFMEWMLANGSPAKTWSDRPLLTDYTYAWRGVPLELMIQLANTLNVSPWFNIPHQAIDDFVRNFAATVNQQLNPALKPYVEYSNETWNTSFSQTAYMQSQGLALALSTDPTMAGVYYSAQRSTQIFEIWRNAFGGVDRFVRVLASQAANPYLAAQTLQFNNAYLFADVLAIAPYFSCSDAGSGGWGFLGDPSTASQVSQMTVDQILDIEQSHIANCALNQIQSAAALASTYGVKLIAYEGGQHLAGIGAAQGNASLAALFEAANRSLRMTDLYTAYLNNWSASGGDLFFHFKDVDAYSQWGSWGALERQSQDPASAPKYAALMQFARQTR